MGVTFAKLEQKDIAFLSLLLNEDVVISSLHSAVKEYDEWLDIYLKFWRDDKDEEHFIIYLNEVPTGWLKLNGLIGNDIAWISMLVISEKHQGKGLGRCALTFSETFVGDRGFSKVGIHTTSDNLSAIALYVKSGYKITEYGDCTTGDGEHRKGYTFIKELNTTI